MQVKSFNFSFSLTVLCAHPSVFFFFSFLFLFFFKFYIPFKIISAHMRRGKSVGGAKMGEPEKNHLTHPQAELGLSHMWPEGGSNPHQTQRLDDRVIKKQRS